uniref:ORF113 n=1 Tax=Spilarctia obliqua nucleopolyhedrovirus TaxID=1638618 RepID=A0A7G9U8F3_9ABAC|nr:ORF113 [Spilarctia obliqua nucleopolyhedrovirus]
MEDTLPNTCSESAFAFTTDDLLKNLPFNSVKCAPFKLHHYVQLKLLSNGIIDKRVEGMDELKNLILRLIRKGDLSATCSTTNL